jgi:hypothetical protein
LKRTGGAWAHLLLANLEVNEGDEVAALNNDLAASKR